MTNFDRLSFDRWNQLLGRLGLQSDAGTFEKIVALYSESHRVYHNAEHLADCLLQLDEYRKSDRPPERLDEVELSLWFHDVIYDLNASDNEAQSAAFAVQFVETASQAREFPQNESDANQSLAHRVKRNIMATLHDALPESGDEQLVVDIDLSILGRTPERFARFEDQIRLEYHFVPQQLFRQKRAEILQTFLDRRHIYSLDWFRTKYEAAARVNLSHAIESLRE